MTTTTDTRPAEIRAKRLQDVAEGYEVYEDGMPDPTVSGAAKPRWSSPQGEPILNYHPRYVLVTQYGDKGNYRLRLGDDLRNVEQLAANALTDAGGGEQPICYFDLDELAGAPPRPSEGDRVRLTEEGKKRESSDHSTDGEFYVVASETDTYDGEAFENLCLARNPDADYDDYEYKVDEVYVELVESLQEDERMPVRYDLARIVTQIVFNTVPSS